MLGQSTYNLEGFFYLLFFHYLLVSFSLASLCDFQVVLLSYFHTCFQSVPDNISGKAVPQTAENLQSNNHHDKMVEVEDESKIKQPDISVVSYGENA